MRAEEVCQWQTRTYPTRFCFLRWMLSKFLLKINSGNVRPAFELFTAQTRAEIGSGRFLMRKGKEDPQGRGPNQNFKLDIFLKNSTHSKVSSILG